MINENLSSKIVQIQDVHKIYSAVQNSKHSLKKTESAPDVIALDGVTVDIERGEFTSIAGPSGSGKTTLLNLIGCLDTITSGHIFVDGEDISVMNAMQKTLVRREEVGLGVMQNRKPMQLSGGQQQRISGRNE
ncbi:ATP-binding cassette domain-containing protein [Treponema sp.]|uniref:ATP-binding cassette domain-containing protein n=1 Tax=Treponema sp. TaxID=166 RepID=UPI003FD86423